MTADENSPLYYTVAQCGCVKLLIADTPERAKDVAREIAAAARRGERVERGIARDVWNGTTAIGRCQACEPTEMRRAQSDDRARLAAWTKGEPIR